MSQTVTGIPRRIDQLLAQRAKTLSFEFFPPKGDKAQILFDACVEQVAELGPDFLSMTYGAGGSTRAGSLAALQKMRALAPRPALLAHLTCVGSTRAEMAGLLDEWSAAGIENVLALRGDPPRGSGAFAPVPGGYAYADELIAAVRSDGRFAISCAAFPEGHPEAASRESDWQRLAGKFAAGACLGITQAFLDATDYLAMRRWLDAQGHTGSRIVPSILPVASWPWLLNFKQRFCPNLGLPERWRTVLEPLAGDALASRAAGISLTIDLARDLLAAGAPGLHLYTLNKPMAVAEVVTALRRERLL
ncbi:methylenetetrahydrofolate reductase [Planctomycetota bacterium]|nr:methylenetetrahydrofolate reductase [Planctomycetota bacterium]